MLPRQEASKSRSTGVAVVPEPHRLAGGNRLALRRLHQVVGDQVVALMGKAEQGGEASRLEIVVAVEHRDPRRAAGFDGGVAGVGRAAIAHPARSPSAGRSRHPRPWRRPALRRSSPRSVVYHHHLGGLGLGEGGGDRPADRGGRAPGGDDDRHLAERGIVNACDRASPCGCRRGGQRASALGCKIVAIAAGFGRGRPSNPGYVRNCPKTCPSHRAGGSRPRQVLGLLPVAPWGKPAYPPP